SRALIPTAALLGAVCILPVTGSHLTESLHRLFQGFFALAGEPRELSSEEAFALALETGRLVLPTLVLLFSVVVIAEVGSGLLQTQFLWNMELAQPDFSRLNPLAGLRRLVSLEGLGEIAKSLLEILCLGSLGFFLFYADLSTFASLSS